MKKLLFSIVLLLFISHSLKSSILPNPKISNGKTVFTANGEASQLVDNIFNGKTWGIKANSWLAINVGNGPSKIFLNWNNPSYPWSNELSPTKCPNNIIFPTDFDILVSSNSTNGADGDWVVSDSIRGNIVCTRGHAINFEGMSWVKMAFIKSGGIIDEVEVFDISKGIEDTWFFAGTSITANSYKGTPPTENFADLVNKKHPDYNPVMIRGGIGCISSTDMVNNLSKYLKMAGNVNYWAIEMGTNDAWGGTNDNVPVFKKNLQTIIDSCKAHGIQPIIARVLATSEKAGWQVHPDYLKAIDDLTKENNLIEGPDFYNWFLANPSDLDTDGVHPVASGAASIQRLWAEKMDLLFGGW